MNLNKNKPIGDIPNKLNFIGFLIFILNIVVILLVIKLLFL